MNEITKKNLPFSFASEKIYKNKFITYDVNDSGSDEFLKKSNEIFQVPLTVANRGHQLHCHIGLIMAHKINSQLHVKDSETFKIALVVSII